MKRLILPLLAILLCLPSRALAQDAAGMSQSDWLNFGLAVAIAFGVPALLGNALIALLRWRGFNNAADWVTAKAPLVLAFLAKNKPKEAAMEKGVAFLNSSHRPEARIVGALLESHLPPENTVEKVDPPAPPPAPPKTPTLPGAVVGLVLLTAALGLGGLSACGASPRSIAVDATTVAHDVVDKATPIVEARCVTELDAMKEPQWSERAVLCDVVVPAHDALGLAVIAAKKALAAASVDGQLLVLAAELATAVAEFTASMVKLGQSGGAK